MHPEFQGFDGLQEEVSQKSAPFAKDCPKDSGNGEDIHAMGYIEGDVFGDPISGFEASPLVA